jgi:hypothetical protein
LPDRLLFACRTGCCRTTLVVGTSSWGSGSAFARPSLSSPRFSVPFWPVAGRDAVVAVPARADADVVPLLVARAEADPCPADRPLAVLGGAVPFRAPPGVLAAPDAERAERCPDELDRDELDRPEFWAVLAAPPVVAPPSAPSAPTG